MENNVLLSILVIGLVLFLLSNKCKEYFDGGNFIKRLVEPFQGSIEQLNETIKRQLENSQKWVNKPMNINPAERTNFPAACATRGMGTPYCRCSAEQIAKGECPRACGLNRDREHLVMTSCRNMENDDPYGGFQLAQFNEHQYQLRG
jgi:hypothetical protein